MQKYRNKPVTIEAVKLTKENVVEVYKLIHGDKQERDDILEKALLKSGGIHIFKGFGILSSMARFGDYVIRDENGKFDSCEPDIFAKTYEAVEGGKK